MFRPASTDRWATARRHATSVSTKRNIRNGCCAQSVFYAGAAGRCSANWRERVAHVVLSGRLAMTIRLDGHEAARQVAQFVAGNYERYKLKAVERGELEQM